MFVDSLVGTLIKVLGCIMTLYFSLAWPAESRLMLSLSGVARVCPGGELVIACSTDRSFLEWSIAPSFTLPGTPYRTRLVSASSQIDLTPIVLNMISFNFSHTTHANGSFVPLVSVLSVTDVPDILNRTRINCTDIGASTAETNTATVAIYAIRLIDLGENLDCLDDKTIVMTYTVHMQNVMIL